MIKLINKMIIYKNRINNFKNKKRKYKNYNKKIKIQNRKLKNLRINLEFQTKLHNPITKIN